MRMGTLSTAQGFFGRGCPSSALWTLRDFVMKRSKYCPVFDIIPPSGVLTLLSLFTAGGSFSEGFPSHHQHFSSSHQIIPICSSFFAPSSPHPREVFLIMMARAGAGSREKKASPSDAIFPLDRRVTAQFYRRMPL